VLLRRCRLGVALLTMVLAAWSTMVGVGPASAAGTTRSTNVLDVPTAVVQTTDGPVGYRELGAGSPLLLVMGLSGSMDEWPPDFVDALARHHTVVLFDNAGVGKTGPLPSPLTITAMANQTSALMTALRLGRTSVLGWSMGGMVAQALAVLHPAQVSKLVLAATQPGTGHALPIPAAAAAATASGDPVRVLSVLFPASARAALRSYVSQILSYGGAYEATAPVVAEQSTAVEQWMAGDDVAGARFGTAKHPLLVADGTEDDLNPVANDRALAHEGAGKLLLYPGAGHAFLFQDSASLIGALDRFLAAK
jgi:pimeloyl-ACP methyl ester carboxylesterase